MKKTIVKFLFCLSIFLLGNDIAMAQIIGIKIAGDTCTDLTLSVQAEGTSSSPYFFWEFDDSASGVNDTITITGTSASPFPTHTFSAPGIYNVCVSFQEPGEPIRKVCRKISVQFCCQGMIEASDTCLENDVVFSLATSAIILNYNWNFGDPTSGINNTSNAVNPTHKFTNPGTFAISVSVNADCGSFTSNLSKTIVRCSTNNANCTGLILASDTCFGKDIAFDIQSDKLVNNVNWDFGDAASGISNTAIGKTPLHRFSSNGNFSVKAIVAFDCGTDTLIRVVRSVNCDNGVIVNPPIDSNCKINFPNTFSPNNDNINDRFGGKFNCSFDLYELIIVNRWGQLVFKATDHNNKWDGLINGKEADIGVYYYTLRYSFTGQQKNRISGDVSLVR